MKKIKNILLSALVIGSSGLHSYTNATEVQIQTVLGNINVALFDEATPETVDNFLLYVNSGTYANTVFHRSVPSFIVQSGGFAFNGTVPPDPIPTNPPVINEPEFSNVRGTIAMAKLGGDPNSATSQWFINLNDNSANLDVQNGGFTVFGQVIGDGMEVVDAIAALPIFSQGGVFSELPVRNFTQADANNGVAVGGDNLVIVTDIVIVNDVVDSNPDITPIENTRINPPSPPPTTGNDGGGSSGGSIPLFAVSSLFFAAVLRRFKVL
ncbi:peptidylprolyl isomerase [Agaribacter flavus]|uniref:Peptidyl-prolyl cis-trans isomerase n=1 Tax=Agaribacter flavus TaxID=1902781 RepID=A0ABV7FUL1_9ALTE